MKLGSLKGGGRDGTLIVVDRALARAVRAGDIALTLQKALDHWTVVEPKGL
jgi:fumarylacetoacetate (FAA) hydrolase